MRTLRELFDSNQQQLIRQLGEVTEVEKGVKITRQFLGQIRLSYLENTAASSTQSTLRLIPFLFDTLQAMLPLLLLTTGTNIWHRHQPLTFRRYSLVIMSSIFLVLYLTARGEWLAIVLFGGVVAGFFLPLWRGVIEPTIKIEFKIHSLDFVRQLADIITTLDKILYEVESATAISPTTHQADWAYSRPLLQVIQDLLAAKQTQDSQLALRKAQGIPTLLAQYNIQIILFNGDNAQFFDFLPSLDDYQKTYITLSPALVKEKQLLIRGQVLEPYV